MGEQRPGRGSRGMMNAASLFGGPVVQHYHQAIAVVVAETFEQARAAAALIRVDYRPEAGKFDLAQLIYQKANGALDDQHR